MMALGMAGGIGTGLTIPGMSILFGLVMDDFNEDPSVIQEKIATLSLSFAGLAAFSVISGFFQVYFWTLTGERQTQKFRSKYVKSILSQEMAWFDQRNTTELSTEVSDVLYKVIG
ncbi:hypothetical protein EON65_39765 [archaeon]|nr:MAG: hypothetical protein EON65_39765 [archaeon]